MTKINGYEDCNVVNQPKGLDAYAIPKPYPTMEQVEASRDPYHAPIYTREELVEIMYEATYCCSCENDIEAAIDALIAIGAVRVK
jgi:hypothetical protein